jgi:hypothetical protein
MDIESKKKRFIEFLDKTLEYTSEEVKEKINLISKDKQLIMKIRVKDLNVSRYIIFENKNFTISDKAVKNLDCYIYFDKAKTFHKILTGKILPYNINLIGKFKIIYYNEKGKILSSVYVPAKNQYSKIVKGTRFTLKKEEEKEEKT